MASPSPPATSPSFDDGLTTAQFQDALARHIDVSKPDPLAKGQMENLRFEWEQYADDGGDGSTQQHSDKFEECHPVTMAKDGEHSLRWSLGGTLTFSSEYISIAIHLHRKRYIEAATSKRWENEFYIQLTATANLVSASDHNSLSKDETIDRKERTMKRKLRAGMIKRLRSDHLIRRLLIDDKEDNNSKSASTKKEKTLANKNNPNKGDGIPLCEALIQQNHIHKNAGYELEERVNVHEDSLQGIRNAIFSHTENLDVLELLLSMPYFPPSASACRSADPDMSTTKTQLSVMAKRAYLRLLEDAMFDACEKEGEEDLLDELNISDTNYDNNA
ncbi:hypothetical protein ACHAXR_008283, partial [Thalassiosira sp. AJA248-18]